MDPSSSSVPSHSPNDDRAKRVMELEELRKKQLAKQLSEHLGGAAGGTFQMSTTDVCYVIVLLGMMISSLA